MDKKGNVEVQSLHLSTNTISELENNMLYFRTGIQRDASSVLEDQKVKATKNNDESEAVINALDKIKQLGQEVKRYLLKGSRYNSEAAEAAMAGVLGVQLGGLNFYNSVPMQRNIVGDNLYPLEIGHIKESIRRLFNFHSMSPSTRTRQPRSAT